MGNKIYKVNPIHVEEILELFDYQKHQRDRIEQILFDNHIENFRDYYHIYKDLSKINFVNDFYNMYKLDIRFRRTLFGAISRFEVSLKTKFASFMTQKFGNYSI
jgi:hypothetical protein